MLLAAFVIGMSIYIHTACILIIFLMFTILKLKILRCSLWSDEIESDAIEIVITINNISFVNVIRQAEGFLTEPFKETNYVEMYGIPNDNNLSADNGTTRNAIEKLCNALNVDRTKE